MRIRLITGATMPDALAAVRDQVGEDAVILGTRETDEGFEVTAALDNMPVPEDTADKPAPFVIRDTAEAVDDSVAEPELSPEAEELISAVTYHGVPTDLADRLCRVAAGVDAPSLVVSLAAGMEDAFAFSPLKIPAGRPLALVGAPGAGKTVTAAKLAARATLNGRTLRIATTDCLRPGSDARIAALAALLGQQAIMLAPGDQVDSTEPTLIDTEGVNPFDIDGMLELKQRLDDLGADPVLVMAAGGDPYESEDIAFAFRSIGVSRMVATRLDTARRLGGVMMAAHTGLSIAGVSASPVIADGLHRLNPVTLARMVLHDPDAMFEFQEDRKTA